jgi:hypothetical protein
MQRTQGLPCLPEVRHFILYLRQTVWWCNIHGNPPTWQYQVVPYSLIQYPRFQLSAVYHGLKKRWKIKLTAHNLKNARQETTSRNMVKFSSPNAPGTWPSSFAPVLMLPRKICSILLLAFSLFALVATLSQCLFSESPYLSIKPSRIYVCYTNITLYIAFSIIRGFR